MVAQAKRWLVEIEQLAGRFAAKVSVASFTAGTPLVVDMEGDSSAI
jgi:hypothetical protein